MAAALTSSDTRSEYLDRGVAPRSEHRLVVVYERGRGGHAALARAAALVAASAADLTVVSLVPQDTRPPCCAVYVHAYNRGVRADAAVELREARRMLGSLAERTRFKMLVEGTDPPFEAWLAAGGIELVLLPARRVFLRGARHPLERRLHRLTDVEVRVVLPAGS